MGKLTISMAIFNSYVTNYKRVAGVSNSFAMVRIGACGVFHHLSLAVEAQGAGLRWALERLAREVLNWL
jgi:hypothetical protein